MFIEVFTDGAARGQGTDKPLEAACAFVVYKNKKQITQFARTLGQRTNNQAEYEALIHALLACSMADYLNPTIYCDSSVVVNHVNGVWNCRSAELLPLYMTVQQIKEVFPFRLIQVPRARVYIPDQLCNHQLDLIQEEKSKIELIGRKL